MIISSLSTVTESKRSVADQVRHTWSQEYVVKELEAMGNSGTSVALEFLKGGRIPTSRSGREFVVVSDLDWSRLAIQDRSQLWFLQQWYFIRACALEYRTSGTFDTTLKVLPAIRAWMEVNLEPTALAERDQLNWHDHATALRCVHLIAFLMLLEKAGVDIGAELPHLDECIVIHLRLLTSDEFYSKRTNHGFDQAVALYLIANVFDLGELSSNAIMVARKRLLDEMSFAFSDDGVHVENSPSYHPSMMARLLQTQSLLAAYEKESITFDFDGVLTKAMDFLTYALRPDGFVPLLGDSQMQSVRTDFVSPSSKSATAHLRYSASQGAAGERPLFSTKIFPLAGYAFLRSKWGGKADFTDVIHLSVKCGFLSTYHRHDDDNNILLYAYGEDWLIDGGIYKYEESDPLRIYMRSSFAHNVVSVANAEVARSVLVKARRSGFISWATTGARSEVVGRSFTTAGFRYERGVCLDRETNTVEIADRMIRLDKGGPDTFQLRFHFPNDKEVARSSGGVIDLRSRTSGRIMRIELLDGAFSSVEFHSGQRAPSYAGWHSPEIGKVVPATTIVLHAGDRSHLQSKVRLSF